ncbi:hypothetical protein BCR44DRAFT_62359 [Catenaria anguillulae PL171]|uniref:Uncharacterized protein n=1 Tax=Catenaria anguillulae PL171 TaxID=765915 RepID=A0A1Y2H7Q5_9FUNG|nr:hypothetical protein BCR44DRAFT_62359 [Catenaria anguillulae PL171]
MKGIKELVHGAVTGEVVGVPAVQLTAVVPLVKDAMGEAGVWVLNWEAYGTPYVRGVSRTPQAGLARPQVASSKGSRTSSIHAASLDRMPLATTITLSPDDPRSDFGPESDDDTTLTPAHRASKKRSQPVDSDDSGTDAVTEDGHDSLPPPAQRQRLLTPIVVIPSRLPRPKTQTPPRAQPPAPHPPSSSSPRASTGSVSSTSTAPRSPSRSSLSIPSSSASAPALMDRDHARHLAQLTMTRLQLRQTYPWATDTWYYQVKDSMHVMGDSRISMHSLRRCAELTAAQLEITCADETATATGMDPNKLVPQVVAYTLVERKYPGIAFEYVDALFEAAGEMGVPVNAETLEMCAGMLMEG